MDHHVPRLSPEEIGEHVARTLRQFEELAIEDIKVILDAAEGFILSRDPAGILHLAGAPRAGR